MSGSALGTDGIGAEHPRGRNCSTEIKHILGFTNVKYKSTKEIGSLNIRWKCRYRLLDYEEFQTRKNSKE